jgi:molybdopterin molybdotransferase
MRSVEQALQVVAAAAGAPRRRREDVPLAEASGRVLAEDVRLDVDVPPFPRATMDGYAVRAADLGPSGATLEVVGHVAAGAAFGSPLPPGRAVAIMTGAPLPEGADTVVPIERADLLGATRGAEPAVALPGGFAAGRNVSPRGELAEAGQVVVRAGSWIHPATVGVLAAAGRARVPVAQRPRVVILATGDELVAAGARPGPSQIRDTNGHTLGAQCARAGATARYDGPVADGVGALSSAIEGALGEADVVLLTGGVSMGERDLVPGALAAAGVTEGFHRWGVKPGGPLWFGHRGEVLVFGLPGNPAASFVGFEVAVVPALRVRMGLPFAPRDTVPALRMGAWPEPTEKRQFLPVELSIGATRGFLAAHRVPSAGSADLFALGAASGLAVVYELGGAEGARSVAKPEFVDVLPLGTFLGRSPS